MGRTTAKERAGLRNEADDAKLLDMFDPVYDPTPPPYSPPSPIYNPPTQYCDCCGMHSSEQFIVDTVIYNKWVHAPIEDEFKYLLTCIEEKFKKEGLEITPILLDQIKVHLRNNLATVDRDDDDTVILK